MKRPGLTPALVSATLFIATSGPPGLAQPSPSSPPPSMGMASRLMSSDELLKRFDRNGDGRIDDDERADAREALMKEQVERQMMRTTVGSDTPPPQPDMLATERVVRAAIEADPVQRRAFDRDGDHRLSDTEWAAARERLARHWVGATTRTPEEERRRLEAVAAEVERRRALREKDQPVTPQAPKEPMSPEALAKFEAESKRLEAVAGEVERRRQLREKAEASRPK